MASAKVARFIVETLVEDRFNLVDSLSLATMASWNPIKNLIIVNGPMAFCDFLPKLAELVTKAERVFWVQQDYTIMPPAADSKAESPFRKAFADRKLRPHFWTTVKKNVKTSDDRYINWNQLTWEPKEFRPLAVIPTLMYYGAYREKRVEDFKKYFTNAPYPVHVSTTTLRGKKFKAIAPNIQVIEPFVLGGCGMPVCSASLYIEDERSHKEFHSPANRFYELLSEGVPILFDAKTIPMLGEAGIVPNGGWIVGSQEDVAHALKHYDLDEMRRVQRERWGRPYKEMLKSTLLSTWESYKHSPVHSEACRTSVGGGRADDECICGAR